MLIQDFFNQFDTKKDSIIENFRKYIDEKNIQSSNKDCPYIEKIIESRYHNIKTNEIKKQNGNLRKFNVID